jgi:hypothetical protein
MLCCCTRFIDENVAQPFSMEEPIYKNFLGAWSLDTATCEYEQGEPPWSDLHRIEEDGDELVFIMDWTDAEGETHHASFRAKPDGSMIPFNGGPLADALQVSAPSETELNSSAFRGGVELMTAVRTLDDDGVTLNLKQTVQLPDGTSPSNYGTYVREE